MVEPTIYQEAKLLLLYNKQEVTTMDKHKLVIVSGATGDLGRAYLDYYSIQNGTISYGLARRDEKNPVSGVTYLSSNLENAAATKERIDKISLEGVIEVLLIHPVGKFKFEENRALERDQNKDGIDDEVYTSNVDTFHNLVRPLIEQREKYGVVPLKLVAFGSLSDQYNVPWWGSYSKSKLILRQDMRELSRIEPNVESLFVNLSSVETSNEQKTRPYADTHYWLKPEEIVTRSAPIIQNMQHPYQEIDIFNASPHYSQSYYRDFDRLREKWLREMKGGTHNE